MMAKNGLDSEIVRFLSRFVVIGTGNITPKARVSPTHGLGFRVLGFRVYGLEIRFF